MQLAFPLATSATSRVLLLVSPKRTRHVRRRMRGPPTVPVAREALSIYYAPLHQRSYNSVYTAAQRIDCIPRMAVPAEHLPVALSKMHLFLLALQLLSAHRVAATTFTLENHCPYPVWPGTLSGNDAAALGGGGFFLPPGASQSLQAPPGWSGRFWARTDCNFDPSGTNGACSTGDCGGLLQCTGGGAPPVSLAEFTIGEAGSASQQDFYDVSLVDGYNVGIGVRPSGGASVSASSSSSSCRYAGCVVDLNQRCPAELRMAGKKGQTAACRSACDAFNTAEYCCTGDHASPDTCGPTNYSRLFKDACPTAYSYAYDDASSTCTCPQGTDYVVTFCPSS